VRLEERLGYVHKGVEGFDDGRLARSRGAACGADLRRQTVAYSIAFARAVESALASKFRSARIGCAR